MMAYDPQVKKRVSVAHHDCPRRTRYWPRPDPGVFCPGQGYRTREPGRPPRWLCGTRELDGCPADCVVKE